MGKTTINYWLISFFILLVVYLALSFCGTNTLFFVTSFEKLLVNQEPVSIVNFLSNTIQNWQVDYLLQLLGKFYQLTDLNLLLYYSFFSIFGFILLYQSLNKVTTFRHGREVNIVPFLTPLESNFLGIISYLLIIQIFKYDLVILGIITWIPYLILSLRNFISGKFLSIFYLLASSLLFISSARQYSLIIIILLIPACHLESILSKKTLGKVTSSYHKLIFFLICLASLTFSLFQTTLRPIAYPDNVKALADDSRTEIYRPLIGSTLNINLNNLSFEQTYFLLPAIILFFVYCLILLKNKNKLVLLFSLLPLSLLLHVTFSSSIIKYLPLHTISLLLPNFFYGPKVGIFLLLSFLIVILFNRNKSTFFVLFLFIGASIYINNQYFQCYFDKINSINQENVLLNSPGNSFLLNHTLLELKLAKRLYKKPSYPFAKLNPIVTSNYQQDEIKYLLDKDNATSWSSKTGKQDGSELINIKLNKIVKMQGIELSVHHFPADFPRGLKIQASVNCIDFKTIYNNNKWTGSIGFTKNQLPFYTAPNLVKIFFYPQPVKCLIIKQTGISQNLEWRISELNYLPAKKSKKKVKK